MSSNFNFPPPGGAPNANSSATPLRPYYGAPLDSSLQSYYSNTLATSQLDLDHENELNTQQAAKELVSYGALKYLTLAIAAPFEAGQTLLQVQYLPDEDESSAETDDATWAADEVTRRFASRDSCLILVLQLYMDTLTLQSVLPTILELFMAL